MDVPPGRAPARHVRRPSASDWRVTTRLAGRRGLRRRGRDLLQGREVHWAFLTRRHEIDYQQIGVGLLGVRMFLVRPADRMLGAVLEPVRPVPDIDHRYLVEEDLLELE